MAQLKIRRVHDRGRMPEYVDGVFLLYPRTGNNQAVYPDKPVFVKTGVALEVPKGHIVIVSLADEVTKPDTGLALAQGILFIRPGETEELALRVTNNSTTARVIRNEEPIAYFVDVTVTEFGVKTKNGGK